MKVFVNLLVLALLCQQGNAHNDAGIEPDAHQPQGLPDLSDDIAETLKKLETVANMLPKSVNHAQKNEVTHDWYSVVESAADAQKILDSLANPELYEKWGDAKIEDFPDLAEDSKNALTLEDLGILDVNETVEEYLDSLISKEDFKVPDLDDDDEDKTVTFRNAKKDDDLLLTDDQADWLFSPDYENKTNSSGRRMFAGTQVKGVRFWPNGVVPYVIQLNHFNQEETRAIRNAMKTWEKYTCLRFVKWTNEQNFVYIHHTDDGCYSLLGMAGGQQPLSLQGPGCRQFGTYLHELGHAIGLVHEHQLPTRNNYVRFYSSNVDPKQASQLRIYNDRVINTYGSHYSLSSIMHYGIISFSIDDMSPTLGIDNPWFSQHIGRRYSEKLDFSDAKTVNNLYKCAAKCTREAWASCPQNIGYLDEDCVCITPMNFKTTFCKNSEGMDNYCYGLVPTGQCDIENPDHHHHCSKACGFCPQFNPGDSAIGLKAMMLANNCYDRYHEPHRCKAWAQTEMCNKSPWMHRHCRRTCGACASKIGDCPNLDNDSICDKYAKMNLCGVRNTHQEFFMSRCQDSCGTCGYRREDLSCRNRKDDEYCKKMVQSGMCDKNPKEAFQDCPSSCNRCYWNRGNCNNKKRDDECLIRGLRNHCTVRGKLAMLMHEDCPRTCGVCPR